MMGKMEKALDWHKQSWVPIILTIYKVNYLEKIVSLL